MNKEALKSIYAYNMLFNNVSGNDTTDNNVKLNTNLISDFDLQNFNPKRFEYYTTLLKMFDNDQETLEKLLAKYNSVKSLRVKERKLIREINDYVNKINKTKTVGGGATGAAAGSDTFTKKLMELKKTYTGNTTPFSLAEFSKKLYNAKISNKGDTSSKKQDEKSKDVPKKIVPEAEDKYSIAFDTFLKASNEFEKSKLKLKKEDIDKYEESINVFEMFIKSSTFMSGGVGISKEKVETFIDNINDHNNIIPETRTNFARDAIDLIRSARKYVEESRKNLIDPEKEKNDIAGNLKAQVFLNPALKELLKVALQKEAVKSSEETSKLDNEAKILSAKASALEAYTSEYVAFANLQVEIAEEELEKAEAVLASLPSDTRDDAKKLSETIKNVRSKRVAKSRLEVYKAKKDRDALETTFTSLKSATHDITVKPKDVEVIKKDTDVSALKTIRELASPPEESRLTEQENKDYINAKTQQGELLDMANTYKPITGHNISNIIIIQEGVKAAELALQEIKDEAAKAKDAFERVKVLLDTIKECEKDIGDKAKEAKRASKNPDLVGEEKAKEAKKEAESLITKVRDLVTDVEAQKQYAFDCAKKVYNDAERVKAEVLTMKSTEATTRGEASALIHAKAQKAASTPRVIRTTPPQTRGQGRFGHAGGSSGGASPEEKYSDDTLKAQYLEKQRYRSIPPRTKEEFRDVKNNNKGTVVRIKTDNKIEQLSNDIDTYNTFSVEDREDNKDAILKKIKDFENDPQNPLEELEITLDDRIVFIIATFFIRYITLLMVQWCIDINIITSFYEGFIYYAVIYIILFWFVVLFINIDNSYDVKYMNFNGIINSIRSLFFYFYMGTNGISRLLIHTSLIILLIVIPIILNIKKKPEFKDEANHDDTVATVKLLNYDERKQLSKTLTLFTMFIWLFTSIIATKF